MEKVISDFLARELEKARAGGEIRDCDPQVVAFMMIRLYIALTSDWSKHHDPLSKEEIKNYFRLFLMEGIAAITQLVETCRSGKFVLLWIDRLRNLVITYFGKIPEIFILFSYWLFLLSSREIKGENDMKSLNVFSRIWDQP